MSELQPLEPQYGGLALIGGLMIRGERAMAVALRDATGGINLTTWTLTPLTGWRRTLSQIPFVRGLLSLWLMLEQGRDLVNHSLRASEGELKETQIGKRDVILALALMFGVIFVLPSLIVAGMGWLAPALTAPLWSALLEAVVRVALMVGMIALLMPAAEMLGGVRSYHGAEHQVIHAYESCAPLTAEGVAPYSPLHPRCGTNLALTLLVTASLVFGLLNFLPLGSRLLAEVVLFLLIAGIVPEWLTFASRHWDNRLVRALAFPGIALQLITTRQPAANHREVALAAMRGVLESTHKASVSGDLLMLVRDANADVRAHALRALGEPDAARAADALRALLAHPDLPVRWRAFATLRQADTLTDADVQTCVAPLLASPELEQRLGAIGQLVNFGGALLAPFSELLGSLAAPMLHDESPVARANTAYLLGILARNAATVNAIPMLIDLLGDADAHVRGNVAHLLGALRAREAAPRLLELLRDADARVQWSASQALVWLRWRDALPVMCELRDAAEGDRRKMFADAVRILENEPGSD